MAASFIPPTADLGVHPVPAVVPSIPGLTTDSTPEPVAHTIPAIPGEPRPVAPAEQIGVPPAKALDPIAEPGLLSKAREVTMPYITKFQETAKPYADAAEQKVEQLFTKIEGATMNSGSAYPHTADGTPVLDTAAPYAAGPNARSAPATTAGQEGVVGGGAGEIGEKAKHFFEQGLATVSSTFNQITHTLEEKTKSDTHPGIVTQATTAFEKGVNRVDGFLHEKTAGTTTTTTSQTLPVQTTTNTVPHADPSVTKPTI